MDLLGRPHAYPSAHSSVATLLCECHPKMCSCIVDLLLQPGHVPYESYDASACTSALPVQLAVPVSMTEGMQLHVDMSASRQLRWRLSTIRL